MATKRTATVKTADGSQDYVHSHAMKRGWERFEQNLAESLPGPIYAVQRIDKNGRAIIGRLSGGMPRRFTYKRAESPYAEGTAPVGLCEQGSPL